MLTSRAVNLPNGLVMYQFSSFTKRFISFYNTLERSHIRNLPKKKVQND